ncbi:glycine--tRNA ligase subunit beta [Alphaproteobacteria bacterium]|nr:glycine--tRNA ligase subunit beta [Alphaproteobacteria bacterium]
MAELLVELYSEEIPAGLQETSVNTFKTLLVKSLLEAGLSFNKSEIFWSPMRLTVCVEGLALKSSDIEINKRGPRVDANEMAINGFAKGLGVAVKELCKIETDKGEFYFYRNTKKGINTSVIIEQSIKNIILNFPWKKSMRWGTNNLKWIRPLHKIVCVFDEKPIIFNIENIYSSNKTYGHRFVSPNEIIVNNKKEYVQLLLDANVIVDPIVRQDTILRCGKELANQHNLIFKPEKFLLEEVSNIIEYPYLFIGEFDKEYLSLPAQILELTMIKQQKYFPLYNVDKTLSKKFLAVSNIPVDNNSQIISGNERVLKARLSDARFFFDNDVKNGLTKLSAKLKNIIFHRSLGSMEKKVQRISLITEKYSDIFKANKNLVVKATMLCKADLCSEVVYEMPELQGKIGSIYAEIQGMPSEIVLSIKEHYSPLGPSDNCPTSSESSILSLSDKLDSLIGFIAIDMKATGSKDPFGLRRSCLGIIRIVLENKIRMSMKVLALDAYESYKEQDIKLILSKEEAQKSYIEFIYDRLKVFMKDKGFSQSSIQAVYNVSDFSDILDDFNKIESLDKFINDAAGKDFLNILKRVRRILSIEEKQIDTPIGIKVNQNLLEMEEEKNLYNMQVNFSEEVNGLIKNEEYEKAMKSFSRISIYLEKFFESVKVNVEDKKIKNNRLMLLSMIRSTFINFADFSLIEAENEVK